MEFQNKEKKPHLPKILYSNSERSNYCFKDLCRLWSFAFRYNWIDDFRPTLLSIITSEHIVIIGSRNIYFLIFWFFDQAFKQKFTGRGFLKNVAVFFLPALSFELWTLSFELQPKTEQANKHEIDNKFFNFETT